jgi:hypothetical protein
MESTKYSRRNSKTYHNNWKEHVERMQDGKFPNLALKYQPVGKLSRGRPKEMERPVLVRVEEYRINKPSQQFRKKLTL